MAGTYGMIGQVNIGENSYLIGSTLFATSSSLATDETKVANLQSSATYAHATGITIHVKFTYANSETDDTKLKLQIGSSTAQLIRNPNGALSWEAGSIISFTNDGTYWIMNSSAIDGSSIQNLSLGNITNEGKITGAASQAVVTNSNAQITAMDLSVSDPTANGNSLTFIDTISQNAQGKITVTKKTVQNASRSQAGVIQLPTGNTTTKFLREDGSWIEPPNDQGVTSITPGNGLINGTSGDSQAAITGTGTISIKAGGVTNAMLAGSIANGKLSNSKVTIAGQDVSLGGSVSAATLREKLGLTQALRFVGSTSTTMSDGYTGTPTGISIYTGIGAVAPAIGDVVIDSSNDSEYVCVSVSGTTYTWERLGRDSSWALDTAVIHTTGTKGDLLYWSDTDTPSHLTPNTDATKKFLSMTGTGSAGSAPVWVTLEKADVGLSNVTNHAQVTAITWDSTNKKLQQSISGGTATDIVTASTLKSAMALNNVTNDAQIKKAIGTTKGDIIYFNGSADPKRLAIGTEGKVLTVSSSGIPEWADNVATDEKVKQSPYTDSTNDKTFNLLFKYTNDDNEETNYVYYSTINSKKLTFNPKSGTLTATAFSGSGADITGITTNHISGTGSGTKYLRQDGWKTVGVSVTANDSGSVLTGTTYTSSTFTQGTLASASVNNGILTIVNQTADTFTSGSLTVSKANLGISAS